MYLGTKVGGVTLRWERTGWRLAATSLAGHDVWVVACQPGDPATLYAGLYGENLYRSTDAGQTWQPIGEGEALRYVRAIAFSPQSSDTLYVGTEPANIYKSTDGGDTWRDLEIRHLPGSDSWFLPYSPRAGAVRTFALHPAEPHLIYAGIEQGGVLKSVDAGDTWTITRDGVHPDIHALVVHPDDPQLLFAATGGGVYRTHDGGETWDRLIDDYTRGVAIHPIVPEVILAGPARRVGREGRILASQDGGDSWMLAARGLEIPMLNMVDSFIMHPDLPNDVFAITSQGRLLRSRVDHIRWRPVATGLPPVRSADIVG
ncbi:MAG: WD40/YVTN/BNR-like repeat-containing protein [Anaerolineae bacterium]